MAYTVTIKYVAPDQEACQVAMPIASIFQPCGSYVDSAVMVDGGPIRDGEENIYGKSIYATNVNGWGEIEVKEPFASTSIPMPVALAQFKLAVADAIDGTGDGVFTFDVEDYKEAVYYATIGEQMADQGFQVTVAPKN